MLLFIYVGDNINIGNNWKTIEDVIDKLSKTFTLKDLGNLNLFLKIEVKRTRNFLYLVNQSTKMTCLRRLI